jgi:hypothetical protein
MKKRRAEDHHEPTIAPGMNDHKNLDQNASKEEIARGDYTEVVTLSYDEVDPSE